MIDVIRVYVYIGVAYRLIHCTLNIDVSLRFCEDIPHVLWKPQTAYVVVNTCGLLYSYVHLFTNIVQLIIFQLDTNHLIY